MKAELRRKEIISRLVSKNGPVSGSELAEALDVSRQIIVHDIAILKAAGYEILSTHSGYILNETPKAERAFKVRHMSDRTKEELSLIVDMGGTVDDVFVWHKVYGKVQAKLNIFSKRGIEQFIDGINSGRSTELMNITDGYHYHTVKADSNETLDKIEKELKIRGFLVPEVE